MSDLIKLLPDHVANQIAAGEVVQRPASVVKELLENAIDAGATHIQLNIVDSGKTLIQVIDNGKGMSMTDARMAFERHATSKISNADDLFRLTTKGFRGEALASVAAVAAVTLKTKGKNDDLGTSIQIEGSKVIQQVPVVTTQGTMISVRNLFFNIPARRKFLKSDQVELRNITDEFHRVALVHPNISFVYSHNKSELFNLPVSNYRQRIVNLMGARINEQLVPVEEETDIVTIKGFIGKPQYARKTKGMQFFFVNNRFIKHSYLNHAVMSAYEGMLKDRTNPSYYLFLTVPMDSVDINIHPTKTEVKFDNEHDLYAIVRASVKHALGQYSIDAIDFNKEQQYEVPYEYAKKIDTSVPRIEVNPDFNPFNDDVTTSKKNTRITDYHKSDNAHWESLYAGLESESTLVDQSKEDGEQQEFFETSTSQKSIFQLQRKYIVSPLSSGLLVIHQHRAHMRILYERLLKEITMQPGVSQQLLFPLRLNIPAVGVQVLEDVKEQLENTGFVFKTLKDNVVELEALPIYIKENQVSDILESVIKGVQLEIPDNGFSQTDHLATMLASSMAIKTGELLNLEQMEQLVDELFACKDSEMTPQQQKVFINLSGDSLNQKFN